MPEPEKLPPISHQPLSVVLLARDAAGHVEATLAGWLADLDRRGGGELIVVDDGSADGTAALLGAAAHPRLRVHAHDRPQGVGAALRTGLAAARGPLVFYTLCDPVYRPEHLAALFDQRMPGSGERMLDHVHLLSGFRAGTPTPPALRLAGWLWRALLRVALSYPTAPLPGWLGWSRVAGGLAARAFLGVHYHDAACPVRLMRGDVLRRAPTQCDGPMAHVELVAKVNFLGGVLGEEVPLDVRPGPYRGDAGAILREAWRLFNRPDFGPAALPEVRVEAP